MKTALPLLLILFVLSGCSIEKRHYRKGFFVDRTAKKNMRVKTYPVLLLTPREPVLTASVESSRATLDKETRIENYRVYNRNRNHFFKFKFRLNFTMPKIFHHQKRYYYKRDNFFKLKMPALFVKHGRTISVHHWRRK